jgi:hypothetical protein
MGLNQELQLHGARGLHYFTDSSLLKDTSGAIIALGLFNGAIAKKHPSSANADEGCCFEARR